ncbi:MAG: MBOAT family protein [Clostridiales bacterium]|nr:MBOAT family protein [Clostridiales bacterium]
MSFNTLDFLLLFFATLVLYFLLPHKLRNPLLLISSYVFYAAYDLKLTAYLVITTLFAYVIGILIDRSREGKGAKVWMIIGVCANVLVLAFYKYFNFLSSTAASFVKMKPITLKWLVPLGISFITFTVISYIVDVYRGKIKSEKNILKFALFVSFFPKVVQGPIERAGDILPQFDVKHSFDLERFREGMLMAIYGLFMKMVVADTAAIIVNTIYGDLETYSGAAVLLATVLFSFQIYFDFAGYSYTAIGAAKVLGFDFSPNFCQPYMSLSVSEFWRRWHCSLNRWLTEYIYIPLGGSRCSKRERRFNVLVTFGISGLWHGADWGYVIWGLLNGVYVNIENMIKGAREKRGKDVKKAPRTFIGRELKRILTFILITFTWVFFRTEKLSFALAVFKRIFTHFRFVGFIKYVFTQLKAGPQNTLFGIDAFFGVWPFVLCFAAAIVVDVIAHRRSLASKKNIAAELSTGRRWLRWGLSYIMIFAIIIFGIYGYGYNSSAFIYAGF